ncbi:MAG: NAD-glutamate dehydrogenase [Actinobacteria bacterium]|nr:NAD-glutamate dehydrogenase [Actinomycetota bacterium]
MSEVGVSAIHPGSEAAANRSRSAVPSAVPSALPSAEDAVLDVAVFLRRYLAHSSSQLPGRPPSVLQDIAVRHLALGRRRQPDEILVTAYDVDADTSAIDVICADAPYLIDSIRAELDRSMYRVEQVLHPQIVVERSDDGLLSYVVDVEDNAELPDGATAEAWIHLETDVIPAEEIDGLVADVHRVLTDVHYAVVDAPAMYALIRRLGDELTDDPGQFDRETSIEAGALLRWLADGNFMILGHASYSANELASTGREVQSDTEGILRGEATITPLELLPAFRSGAPLVIFKSPLVSTVRRSVRYDCVTVITPGRAGEPQRVHVFLGLISNAEDGNVQRVPVVRRRIAEVLLRSGARANSYTGRQLLAALRTMPRDELLEAPTGDLLKLAPLVVDRAEHAAVGVFARVHLNRDFVTVLVYFPAERFGPETRRKVRETITRHWPGELVARDDRIVELGLARMQFLIALRPGLAVPEVDRRVVEAEVAAVTRRWSDDLADLIAIGTSSEDEAERRLRRYTGAFPEAYKEDFGASTAVEDISRLEGIPDEDGLAFAVYRPPADDGADRRLKVYRTGQSLSLARALPIFVQMGIEVLDERPYEISRPDGTVTWIYDFGLRLPLGVELDAERTDIFVEALRHLWRGEIEQDGFNALVTRAGMTWWQANVLRAYAKYLRQAGSNFSQGYIEQALVENAGIAVKLVNLFQARFDPQRAGVPQIAGDGSATLVEEIEAELAEVDSLDQDRIVRSLLGLIRATLRTNAYRRRDSAGTPNSTTLAMKLDPRLVPDLPSPRPRFEIWVYSPRVEGVHLRFGPVARGGLRWSDRREDFRTEILGLVKAQMVKNAVIVPVGAKGGFVAKRLPDPARDREAWLAEGVACYRTFISCLLDLTDNYAPDGSVVAPPDTRRYDGDDPYLVVAADKGTATFSDIANDIAAQYDFWLGDAFASGGSVGYDHKAMGITARGAWESVKYHFRELDIDTQTQDFTVVGVGDMSGDVFGNGMLLSEHIRLVAAFDHRHIFLDPDPDAAVSFAERRRLFDLPRSSWADYDLGLISPGGGVFARTMKSIPIAEPVATRLGLAPGVSSMTPAELMHAILVAPVDLLFNGGIGTYVKASTESQAAVGDKANDALRADAAQLRCRVVAEGGNLGFTQLGRIEYARGGGHINTDAIDNSAGVDTSDHEVNIKVLLDRAVAAGALAPGERNELLLEVTDDVAAHVLRDNYLQNVLLGMARRNAPQMITVAGRFIRALEQVGDLDRALEFLPSQKEIEARAAAGLGMTSPEQAVMAAYAKITLAEHITDSTLPDEPWFQAVLREYFPRRIAARLAETLTNHPLHREIVSTSVVNDVVNRAGISYVHRAIEETGVDVAQVARAYTITREVFGLEQLWNEIEQLDNRVPTSAQHAAYQEIRRLLDRATRWLVDVRFPITDVAGEIARFQPTVRELSPGVTDLLRGSERETLLAEVDRLVALGLPRDLSLRIGELLNAFLLLDVVEIAAAGRQPPAEVADLHFALSERFSVDEMLTKVTLLPRTDRWTALARAALRHDVYAALSAITTAVLRTTDQRLDGAARMRLWEKSNAARVERARATLAEALSRETVDLATLSVALRVMRGLPS